MAGETPRDPYRDLARSVTERHSSAGSHLEEDLIYKAMTTPQPLLREIATTKPSRTIQISANLKPEYVDLLKHIAKVESRTRSSIIESALKGYVGAHHPGLGNRLG